MKYLILGSSGQIGSALVKYLLERNEEVVTFDIVANKNEDLRISGVLNEIMLKVDFVYFLAFDIGGSRYLEKYQKSFEFIHNNILLQTNTFETIKKHNKPFIFASTQMSNMTFSEYGLSKRLGEVYTQTLGGLIVKFWNVYGVEDNEEKFHVISDFILKARNYNKIEMMTDGTEERQFLHAEDCCECLYILSKKYQVIPRQKDIHITSFKWDKIINVAEIIANIFNISAIKPATKKDNVQKNTRNEPDDFILKYWKPKTNLKEGIKKVINQNYS